MTLKTSLASIALLASLGTAQAAPVDDEAHIALKAVARWGMCLLETQTEDAVKPQVFSVVQQIDRKFQSRYGVKATTLAQARFGDNFVEHYYAEAKAHHATLPEKHADMCVSLGNRVISLSR